MGVGSRAYVPPMPWHLREFREGSAWGDRTIGDRARELAMVQPDMIVLPGADAAYSYQSLLSDAEALAVSLADLGLVPGDVIAFQLPNWAEAMIINLAAALGGFVINPIVPIYRDAEVRQMLSDGRARAFFFAEHFRGYDFAAMVDRIAGDLPHLRHRISVRGQGGTVAYDAMLEAGRRREIRTGRVDPDSVKLLLYTSGTTGTPKGVLHSHNSLSRVATVSFRHWGIGAGDVVLMPSPVTHISGYSNGLEQPFLTGTRTVLMESWNAEEALDLIERHDVAATVAATPFLKELADLARSRKRSLPSLRSFACGGAAVAADLVRDVNDAFAQPCAFRVYGSSEVPLVTLGFSPREHPDLAAETDGMPVDYAVRIVDEDGNDVSPGSEGEIIARGPAMFLGYADDGQTRESLTVDGYFRTGDLGLFTDDGAITITGRKKDLIIRGGENISAKEIEDVLAAHPAVREAAVVSMPHARLGEGISAFIVLNPDMQVSRELLAAHVAAAGLAKQKCPERVDFIADLPRTASGKIRKDILRQEVRAAMERESGLPA